MPSPLTKEQIRDILDQEHVNVNMQFRHQLKESFFQEMIMKLWEAIFIITNPEGKELTKKFIKTFDEAVYKNFMENLENSYNGYCVNNQFCITKEKYKTAFASALETNKDDISGYFDLDKKIITPS